MADRRARVEPWLDAHPRPPEAIRPRPRREARFRHDDHHVRRRWLLGAGALLLAVIVALIWLRPTLAEWLWPETPAEQLREQAAEALIAGRLSRPDGRGARELFEAALALEPDRSEAREGLARVGQAALARARTQMQRARFAQAHEALALARELHVPQARITPLAEALRQREAAAVGLGRLLLQAEAARAAGRLDGGADTALPLYQRVLALQPDQVTALQGRADTLADMLSLARQAMARADLAKAARLLDRVQAVDPGHAGLPDARAALAQHVERRRRQAADDLKAGRLDKALHGYRLLAEVAAVASASDPSTTAGTAAGVARVAAAYAQRSERLAADFHFEQARAALHEAQAIAPEALAVVQARQHLESAQRAQQRLQSPIPQAQRQQRVSELLRAAAAAEARGDLLQPPGESMFDKLRAARAIAPRDPEVIAASARLLPAARTCFEDALRRNHLPSAGACLDARVALGDDPGAVRQSRQRLARRWIAVGVQRLDGGDMAVARRAMQAARALDPTAPGLDALVARLQAASMGD